MRRSDREITDKKIIESFIANEQILRVAFYDNGDIYIVPINYGLSLRFRLFGGKYELQSR